MEDLVSTVVIRLLEASILALAKTTVLVTPAVATVVYTAFARAFVKK